MAVERTEDVMQPARKFHPEQYVDVTTPVLAGVVIEWTRLRGMAERRGTGEEYAEVLMHLADACIAWARRRGLVDDRIQAAAADAEKYLADNELTERQESTAVGKVFAVAQRRERTRVLLDRLTG